MAVAEAAQPTTLRERRAANVAALRFQHLAGDVGEHQRMPVLIEILVRDVPGVLFADIGQAVFQRRMCLEERGTGLPKPSRGTAP